MTEVYRDIPEACYEHEAFLQSILICAALDAKYTTYNFEQHEFVVFNLRDFDFHDIIVFTAYNHECSFMLRFNRTTNTCDIEFNTDDDSFDYPGFKKVIDSYFLYN